MLNKSFNKINILHNSLNASWLRNEAISNNIANVNTPGYKKDIVEFESILSDNLYGLALEGKVTHLNHIPLGSSNIENVQPIVKKDMNSKYRKDGNNVNIDIEMAEMAKNSIKYNAMIQRISGSFNKLKLVIKDGR